MIQPLALIQKDSTIQKDFNVDMKYPFLYSFDPEFINLF